MKLYEPSIFLTSRHSMTFTGISDSNDIRPAVDNDKNTLASSNTANPSFSVNFGTGETRAASAIWIRVEGYTRVQVSAGSSEVADVPIGTDGYAYAEFSEASDQNWTLDFTGTGGLYEVYLCRLLLDFDTDDRRPLRWRMPRHVGLFFRAASGHLINFQPFGFGGGRATVTLEWVLLENPAVQLLLAAYRAGAGRNLQFAVYPAPEDRPRHFFQARWESSFSPQYAGRKVSDGQNLSIVFQERDIEPIVEAP